MKKHFLVVWAILLFSSSSLWAASVEIEKVNIAEKGLDTKVTVKGKSESERPILLEMIYSHSRSPQKKFTLSKGAFSISYKVDTRFLYGNYKVLFYEPGKSKILADYSFSYGSRRETLRQRNELRKHLIDLYETCCEAVKTTREGGQFFIETLRYLKKNRKKEAFAGRRNIKSNWRVYKVFLGELIQVSLQNLREFEKSIYINPHRRTILTLRKMLIKGKSLVSKYNSWIRRWIRWRKESSELTNRLQRVTEELENTTRDLARILNVKEPAKIEPSELAQRLSGQMDGNTFKEDKFGFRLKLDPAKWQVSFLPSTPNTRLTLYHRERGKSRNRYAKATVEIYHYPRAKSYRDLRLLAVIMAQEQWPGFRKLTSQKVEVEMNGKKRQGFEFVFITERSNKVSKRSFQNKVYQIFCKDKKTVYSLRFITSQEDFEDYKEDFAELEKNFTVIRE